MAPIRSAEDLAAELRRIDGRGYKAYKDIEGSYAFPTHTLHVDHAQGDPFAEPSRVRLEVPQARAGLPAALWRGRVRNRALCDFLTRAASEACWRVSRREGTGKSGLILIDAPGQEVLERSSVSVDDRRVEARIAVGLPAAGRRILGESATDILCHRLPAVVEAALAAEGIDLEAAARHVEAAEDQSWLRGQLHASGMVAFVGDGSVLPRASGADTRPMGSGAVPFESPESLRCEFALPNRGRVAGMGIREGITLIVGGGYHGKSTLLSAIELGVYDHCPGDGRELVVALGDAVKIRAEDGRSVRRVDISPFIANLPLGKGTGDFSTEDASGSTSQAANIVEAVESGTSLLLIDEDTSATNFMTRDRRMQALVRKEKEPITPFIDKARQMFDELGVSTVIVVGGVGDYLDVADTVIMMDSYRPLDVTTEAERVVSTYASERDREGGERFGSVSRRAPDPLSLDPRRGKRSEKVSARDTSTLVFGRETIDLSAVEQLVSASQTRAIGAALLMMSKKLMDGRRTVGELLDLLDSTIDERGLDALSPLRLGNYARPRRQEIAAALNRSRALRIGRVVRAESS